MIQSYPGSEINAGVATAIQGGTPYTGNRKYQTSDAGVAGILSLYTEAGADLQDGDLGVIDTAGTPILFAYSDAAKNWLRVNPFDNSNACYFVDATKSYGFRNQDATTIDWTDDGTDYAYSDPTHTFTASGDNAFVYTNDLAQSMTEVGFILLHRGTLQTGSTQYPFIDLRRDDGASPYPNLRFRRTTSGQWGIEASPQINSGVAFNINTEYSFEVYYNYATSRCWVYHNYSATPTSIANTAITLPNTTGTSGVLVIQVNGGVWELEGAAGGHMITAT